MDTENSKKVNFKLRAYQADATERADNIFSREEHNKYAAVVLPTGGGKSFVAIQQLLSFNNPNYEEKDRNEVDGINKAKMLYMAPTHEILSQIKLHIVKNVLFSIPNLGDKTIDEIDNIVREDFPLLNFQGINTNETKTPDQASASEKKSAILRNITPEQINKLVENAFPNLTFKCYAGVKGEKSNIQDKDMQDAEFIIVDEAHRLGASEWRPNFEANLAKNPNAKILGITATPERTDREGREMMAEIAKMVYPNETITSDKYLAQEIYVSDAIKDGMVVSPKIIGADALLANSGLYLDILDRYERATDQELKQKLEDILNQMEKIMGFSPRQLTKEQVQQKIDEAVTNTITQQISNINGKYIAFLPSNKVSAKSDREKPDSAEYFIQYMDKIREQFKNVLDENGNPVKITFEIVTSNKSIRLDENGLPTLDKKGKPIVNSQVIKNFEDASNETGGIKILLANNILNEGVHIDGIDGAIMYRKIDSPITYSQQTGRCISSMEPEKPLEEQTRTQIIDVAGNTFYQITSNNKRNISRDYDLNKLKEIAKWMSKNGNNIPDINKIAPEGASSKEKATAEYEARLAITLKRLKARYFNMHQSGSIPLKDAEKIKQILELGDEINIWDKTIATRTVLPSERQLTGEGFMELSPSQQAFQQLYYQGMPEVNELPDITRVNKLLNVLTILKMHKPDINLPQGLYFKTKNPKVGEMQSPDTQNINLEDLLKANFAQNEIEAILVELQDYNLIDAQNSREVFHPGEAYDIGKEMAFVRGKLWTSQHDFFNTRKKLFENYTFEHLISLGLIQEPLKDLANIIEMNGEYQLITTKNSSKKTIDKYIDSNGRLKPDTKFDGIHVGLVEEFEECSLIDGKKYVQNFDNKKYDRFGFDEQGYDMYGYDKLGFNQNLIHKNTGTNMDERGFSPVLENGKIVYVNTLSQSEYDLLGYNIYGFNEEGFERPKGVQKDGPKFRYAKPQWHERKKDGTYSIHGYDNIPKLFCKPNEKSHDAHGFINAEQTLSDNPLLDNNREKGTYFYPAGAKRLFNPNKKKEYPLAKDDFYIELEIINDKSYKIDIDGFDENGYKRVIVNEKEMYIHRETSNIYDKNGRIFDVNTLTPKVSPEIQQTKQIIAMLLEYQDMSMEKIYGMYTAIRNTSIDKAKEEVNKLLEDGFEIYQMYSPNAFTPDLKASPPFKGLDEYYRSNSLSSEKRDRLNQLFQACPRARKILQKQCEIDMQKLKILEEKERKLENNKEQQFTQEEKQTKTDLEHKKEMYQGLNLDDDDQR